MEQARPATYLVVAQTSKGFLFAYLDGETTSVAEGATFPPSDETEPKTHIP